MNKFIHSKKKIMLFGGIGIGALLLACWRDICDNFSYVPKEKNL